MSDVIKLLPDSVANQIAAGEVIQRPASVIKELVENAVDAGASDIRLYIKDAGRTLIQVVDNGKGMSDTDAEWLSSVMPRRKSGERTISLRFTPWGFVARLCPRFAPSRKWNCAHARRIPG